MDTLYIEGFGPADFSYFFSILTEKEQTGLKYLTLDDNIQNIDEDFEDEEIFKQLQAQVESLRGLKELGVAWDVRYGTSGAVWEVEYVGPMRFYETWPAGIEDSDAGIEVSHDVIKAIESQKPYGRLRTWNVPMRTVFAWRKGVVPVPERARATQ